MIEQPAPLSPAQKAAQTRRLNKQAREHVTAVKVGTAAPSPVGDASLIRITLADDECPQVGTGVRDLLVVSVGPKWAQLFYVPLLQKVRLPRVTFDRYAKPLPFDAKRVRATIRDRVQLFQRTMPNDSDQRIAAARAALEAIRGS